MYSLNTENPTDTNREEAGKGERVCETKGQQEQQDGRVMEEVKEEEEKVMAW